MELIKVEKKDKELLENLLQLYLHDLSFNFPIDFSEEKGKFIYPELDQYFENKNNIAYFMQKEGVKVGFILLNKNEDEYLVQELFVLNPYKRRGIGREGACKIFDNYKGSWTIKSLPCSKDVELFWKDTLKEYTKDNYNMTRIGNYDRAVFKFNNK